MKYRKKLIFPYSCDISPNSIFEGANKIYPHTLFSGKMGYGSYIGPNCETQAVIGRYTSIAPHVRINVGSHPFSTPFVTTCPMFFSTKKQNGKTFANRIIYNELKSVPVIGNDCWIGENVFICGGIHIGDGAVVLAGAVVTKDVPPYAIVGGVPAKVLRYRFDEDTIKYLIELKWWNMDVDWLRQHWELLCDIEKLKNYFNDGEK